MALAQNWTLTCFPSKFRKEQGTERTGSPASIVKSSKQFPD
jgi:hypothetical protein